MCAPPGKRPRPRRAAGRGPAYPGCASSAVSRRWRRERGPASGWPAHTQKAAPSQGLRRASTHLGRGQPLQRVSSQRAHDWRGRPPAGAARGDEGGAAHRGAPPGSWRACSQTAAEPPQRPPRHQGHLHRPATKRSPHQHCGQHIHRLARKQRPWALGSEGRTDKPSSGAEGAEGNHGCAGRSPDLSGPPAGPGWRPAPPPLRAPPGPPGGPPGHHSNRHTDQTAPGSSHSHTILELQHESSMVRGRLHPPSPLSRAPMEEQREARGRKPSQAGAPVRLNNSSKRASTSKRPRSKVRIPLQFWTFAPHLLLLHLLPLLPSSPAVAYLSAGEEEVQARQRGVDRGEGHVAEGQAGTDKVAAAAAAPAGQSGHCQAQGSIDHGLLQHSQRGREGQRGKPRGEKRRGEENRKMGDSQQCQKAVQPSTAGACDSPSWIAAAGGSATPGGCCW